MVRNPLLPTGPFAVAGRKPNPCLSRILSFAPLVGAAWVYIRRTGAWYLLGSKLVGAGAVGPAGQGVSVAISAGGDTAILGGRLDRGGVGAAWVFAATSSPTR